MKLLVVKLLVVKLGTRSTESVFQNVLLKQFKLHFRHANSAHVTIFAKHLDLFEGLLLKIDQCFEIGTRDSTQKFLLLRLFLFSMLVAIDQYQVIVRN